MTLRSWISVSLVATSLVAGSLHCSGPEGPPRPAPEAESVPATPPTPRTGSFVFRTTDGNAMPYVVSGSGEPTVVLVHCWMCDMSFWEAQLPVLEPRYTVVRLDLPGHGTAGAERESWTVEAYGHDVAGLLEELDARDVILVGHSMGGPISVKTAALARGRVRGVIAVDSLQDAELKFEGPEVEQILAAFDADFRGTCGAMLQSMFVEEGVEEIMDRVRTTSCEGGNPVVGVGLLHDFGRIDAPAWFREAGVPIRAINAAGPRPTEVATNRKYSDFDVVLIEGVGHYPHMTRPAVFNKRLLMLLETLAR